MSKIIFKYKKSDGTVSDREILRPSFLKEEHNSIKDYNKPEVRYIFGYEVQKTGLQKDEVEKYEKLIEEYFTIHQLSLDEFLLQNNMNPDKVKPKSFKKEGVSDPKLM